MRPFIMGLNHDLNGVSNCHTNIFLPSYQSWIFDWALKIVLILLHGRKTVNRVQLNMFDQAVNEYTPFEENMPYTMLHFYWYHRGLQKTKLIYRKVDNNTTH